MKKLTWLYDLQNFTGVLIGLIMISIGSFMSLNAGAKLYIFGYTSSPYFSPENRCENNFSTVCTEEISREKKRYTRLKQEDLTEGVILIIIGSPLWFFHRQRKEKDVKLEKTS